MILWHAAYNSAPGCVVTLGSFDTQQQAAQAVTAGVPLEGAFVWPVGEPLPGEVPHAGTPLEQLADQLLPYLEARLNVDHSPALREAQQAIDGAISALSVGEFDAAHDRLVEYD